ncbi:zinc finger protein 845 [Caerostris extrusa]|uniref:Zinc finger protein 845 n=1 Tax=Caerostris extrusa TaxID=172846 RepID=A0AAV4YF32_CAEEX|nr:zinc finger protein 845 [Caerostris extrusa]
MACKVCHKSYYFTVEDDQFDSNVKPHVCSTCGQSFSLKVQLKRHAVLHANGVAYVCINCSKDVRLSNQSEGYACSICDETFASKRSLFRHTTKEHTLLKTFTCDDCPECFESASELKTHNAVHKHKTTKRKATKTYNENAPSIKRIKSEIDDKKHVCNVCGKSFSRRTALEGHEVIHVSEKYDSSDEELSEYSWHEEENDEYVDEHKKSRQSNSSINQSYKCENCNFVCFSKKTLNKHMNNHKDEDSEEEENSESEDDPPKNHVNFGEKKEILWKI